MQIGEIVLVFYVAILTFNNCKLLCGYNLLLNLHLTDEQT